MMNASLFADDELSDYSVTRISFTMFRDYASGLSGLIESFRPSENQIYLSINFIVYFIVIMLL